jgi:hypothetical protein
MTQTSFLLVCVCLSFLPLTEYSLNKETSAGTLKWGSLLSTDKGEKKVGTCTDVYSTAGRVFAETVQRLVVGLP